MFVSASAVDSDFVAAVPDPKRYSFLIVFGRGVSEYDYLAGGHFIVGCDTDYYNYFQNYKLPFHTSEYDCAYNTEIFYEINYITKRILVKCTSVYNFVNTFFNLPLQYMCLNEKMFLLHAMGVLDSSNKVALFIGESGVGKSSLLNNLLKTYSFFCDDTAILQICKDTFIVWPKDCTNTGWLYVCDN